MLQYLCAAGAGKAATSLHLCPWWVLLKTCKAAPVQLVALQQDMSFPPPRPETRHLSPWGLDVLPFCCL